MQIDPEEVFAQLNKSRDVVILGGFGLLMLLIGIREWQRKPPEDDLTVLEEDGDQVIGDVLVDISGSVNRPGVYRFEVGSRTGRAIEAAQGFSETADLAWISQNLNLASQLQDGSKLYIPSVGEIDADDTSPESASVLGSTLISVNTASSAELETLSGIGEARAQTIISNRPYQNLHDLQQKTKIPLSILQENKDKITYF